MFKDNPDFFPTPEKLIRKMINKIDFRYVQNCLEPSAGKGDLVEGIKKQFEVTRNYRNSKKYDIDLIEKDENLIHLLKGKGYRVIADDFLNFETYKRYDLIFMNPPYSSGDKHLLKAIRLIESQGKTGQILCLLNAETLKNPYSNIRKELIRLLEQYEADVEYIEEGFLHSERSTSVETAMVYLKIEKIPYNSTIITELKKEERTKENTYNSDKLIQSDFIEGIVSQYNYEVKAGLKLIEEYKALTPYMLRKFDDNSNPVLKLELEYKDEEGSSLENAYIKQIRAKYWSALFSNKQFMGLFTSNLKQKYMSMVEELKDYDFSFYNIYTLRIELSKEMVQGVEDTILNLFEELSYKHHYYNEMSRNILHYNGWKTNKAHKINKKVIIPLSAFHDMQYSWGRYDPSRYNVIEKLQDVEKVFNYLDDGITPEIDMKEVLTDATNNYKTKKIELKYFYVTFFKKNTCHIEFKDMNLLQKFNLVAAKSKMWLPPTYGKVKYSDMSKEEKEVIDDFEGEKSYNKVMKNPSYYMLKTEELLRLTS